MLYNGRRGGRRLLHIIHCDMDAFFAAVEQRDNPRLRGKPVIVGGPPRSRGVVSTASYEARKFGVHSAMPSQEAFRLCPKGVFISPNHEKYAAVSRQIRLIMERFTPRIEPMSLDEAYLDVTGRDAVAIGRGLKQAIGDELHLTASVGISYCKFLAKLASDLEKPDGFTVIDEARADQLLPTLPVRRLPGIGPRSEEGLRLLGIETCGDVLATDPDLLRAHFGRRADELILMARGIDDRPVETEHETKSIGEETTFARDLANREQLAQYFDTFAASVAERLQRYRLQARTVTVKLRWHDFVTITRSVTSADPTDSAEAIAGTAREIFRQIDFGGCRVRLLGLSVSNLIHPGDVVQLRLPL